MFSFFKKSKIGQEINMFDSSYFYNAGKPVWMERDYRSFASHAYVKNVIAHRAISMIAQAAGSVPFKLFYEGKNKRVEVKRHPILDLLTNPNPITSGKELLESLYAYRLINGNAYLLGITADNATLSELLVLRPDRVMVIAGTNYLPMGYQYKVGTHERVFSVDQLNGKSQIVHFRNFHPLSDWYGMSSIEAAAYSIDQHNQAGAWNQSLLQNGARPSGAVVVKNAEGKPATLTSEQYQRLKSMIDENFSGATNSGRPLVLEGGLQWQEMSLSPRDMDFIESKHSSARDIALAFGVPPQLLGIPGDNTYSNLIEARIAMWEQTIIPLLENTVLHLSNWFSHYFGKEYTLVFDTDNVSALASKKEKIWDRIQNANFMTINEKRAAVGLAAIEGGERFHLS